MLAHSLEYVTSDYVILFSPQDLRPSPAHRPIRLHTGKRDRSNVSSAARHPQTALWVTQLSPSNDSAQTGLQLLSGWLLFSHGSCDSIRLSKHSPIMHNALMSYDLFNKWNCISNHLFPLYEWTGIRHGRLTALIFHLMHAYALLPQIQLGFTTLRWTVSSPGQFLIHYSHCACMCVFVAVRMEVHR